MILMSLRRYFAVILLIALLTGCNRGPREVRMQPAQPADASGVDCTGTLHPSKIYTVRVKRGETVQDVFVQEGDEIGQGVQLARLLNPDLRSELISVREKALVLRRDTGQLQELIEKKRGADLRLSELKTRLDLNVPLQSKVAGYDPRVHARPLLDEFTKAETEASQLSQEIARGQSLENRSAPLLKLLEDRAAEIEKQLAELNVRAPFPGTVVRVERAPDPTGDGMVLELHDRSAFLVHSALWQNQLRFVKVGAEVTVMPDFISNRAWTGRVSSIAFAPQAGAKDAFPKFPMVVSLDAVAEAPLLRDGMTVFIRIRPLTPVGISAK